MNYRDIIYEPGPVARIKLNRARYRNAQSRVMIEEMDDAFQKATKDENVRVIILSGVGDHFSAGHDLGTPEELEDRKVRGYPTGVADRYPRSRSLYLEATLRWRNVPKPTIAMVSGYCIFGGYMFASAMDIIFASEDATFLPSHTQYFTAPWDMPDRKAKEILYESRFIPAQEALELGIVNRLIPKDKLEAETLAYAERVAGNDPFSTRMVKFSINNKLDGMGFTESVESAYQTYYINSLARPDSIRPQQEKRRLPGVARAVQLRQQQLAEKSALEGEQ